MARVTNDRFRPDPALRGIVPLPTDGRSTVILGQSGGQIAEVLGQRGDRLVIDDPHCAPGGVTPEQRDAARALFEDRGPIGHVGRHSIPKSHRGEGSNYVD